MASEDFQEILRKALIVINPKILIIIDKYSIFHDIKGMNEKLNG